MADVNAIISNNKKLVYMQLHRFGLANNPDAESYAFEALWKAAESFDVSTGNAFSTYAICIIANALRMYLRSINKKRQITPISYDVPVGTNGLYLIDTLQGTNTTEDAVFGTELQAYMSNALNNVYNSFASDGYRAVFIAWYDSDFKIKQCDIASVTGLSQSFVSRALSAIKYKLKKELEGYL